MFKYIKRNDGSALLLSMIVLLAISILCTSLISLSRSEFMNKVHQEKKMRAYYIARSGAEAALQAWLDSDRNSRPEGTSDTYYITETGEYVTTKPAESYGSFIVDIIKSGTTTTITSTGTIDKTSQRVTVTLKPSYIYGHDLGWYDVNSGQMTPNPHTTAKGTVILGAEKLNKLKDPNKPNVDYQANYLYFESAVGSPLHGSLNLYAECILFEEEIQMKKNDGSVKLFVPDNMGILIDGDLYGKVYFQSSVTYQNDNNALGVSNKAYYYKKQPGGVDITQDLQYLLDSGQLIHIPDPTGLFPLPENQLDIIWS